MKSLTWEEKHYRSAHDRMLESVLSRFIEEHVPQAGGPEIRDLLAKKIMDLFEKYTHFKNRLKPGQMLWTAIDKNTRADSKKLRLKPVVLTIIDEADIEELEKGKKTPSQQFPFIIARILKESYNQEGALLSMRDIGLIFKQAPGTISTIRKKYENKFNVILPTPGSLQDMGSCVTHKTMILRKVLIEKKDMNKVRQETNHKQQAIDRYLKDYRRVEMLMQENKSVEYISKVTSMSPFLIRQYENIYYEANALQRTS